MKAFILTIKDYTISQATSFLGLLTGKPNSDKRTAAAVAKPTWEHPSMETHPILIKIYFTIKNKSQIASVPRQTSDALDMREYSPGHRLPD